MRFCVITLARVIEIEKAPETVPEKLAERCLIGCDSFRRPAYTEKYP